MSKNVWLYFGNSSRTLMVPTWKLRGMHPTTDGVLELNFDSIVNPVDVPTDKVALNLFEDNTHLEVMKAIGRAIHNQTPTFNGFVTVADNTSSTGGGYDTGFFHVPEYLTDHDGTEAGKIASVDSIKIQDISWGPITATAGPSFEDGVSTPRDGVWIVNSDDANKVIHLPVHFTGAKVEYLRNSSSGFELRAKVSTDYINNVTGEVEAAIPSDAARVIAIGLGGNKWQVNYYDDVGNYDHVAVADSI